MALAVINVKKPREAQIWKCSTGNLVLRILPDSNTCFYAFALSGRGYYIFVSHTQGAASLALG